MSRDLSGEETTVVAAYANRHDAETARGFLEDRGIYSFVAGDEVHPPLQITEGVRLHVLTAEAYEAYEALDDADMLPPDSEHLIDGMARAVDSPTRMAAWALVAVLFLIVMAVVAGLLFG